MSHYYDSEQNSLTVIRYSLKLLKNRNLEDHGPFAPKYALGTSSSKTPFLWQLI